jgi:hypothetical protein
LCGGGEGTVPERLDLVERVDLAEAGCDVPHQYDVGVYLLEVTWPLHLLLTSIGFG